MNQIFRTHFESIDSTSNYAKANAASLSLPALITADEQTNGRGRRGNSFFSPKNTGLYMTLLTDFPNGCNLITPAAAVTVCEELEKLGVNPKIKWVNDIFIDKKKVCGILTELFETDSRNFLSVGIGINVTTTVFPDDIPVAGSLSMECDRQILAENIAKNLLQKIHADNIVEEYRKRLFILGKNISFRKNNILFSATAEDINDECNLIVKYSDGATEALSSGEISIKL